MMIRHAEMAELCVVGY